MQIINFGSLNLDFVYQVDTLVRPGETVHARGREVFCGGKGLNQSIAMAKAGLAVRHAGCVGEDGGMLLETLAEHGVDISGIRTAAQPSGHAVIQVDPQGENSIVLYGGANRMVTAQQIEQTLHGCGAQDVLVMQNEISCPGALLEVAHRQGMRIVFNPAPFTQDVRGLPLRYVDTLFVNELEGAALAGEQEPERIVARLTQAYGCTVILTLGKAGARYGKGEISFTQPTYPAQVVDTTGAGDTFTGYYLCCALSGKSAQESMAFAAKAAAITVSRPGAAQAIPYLAEVLALHEIPKE